MKAGLLGAVPALIEKHGAEALSPALFAGEQFEKKKRKQKPGSDGSAGTSVQAMKKGGKVRGCGCAKRGVRKAKMY